MNAPYLETVQTQEGWQAMFAFQVFHRPADEWLAMRWGFNAGALLDEALDRYKLFIESQSMSEAAFLESDQPDRTLAMRGMNLPGQGLQMALIGKASSPEKPMALQAAKDYAREIYSIFPHDFILQPAETKTDYDRLYGKDFFAKHPRAASIQRGMAFIPSLHNNQYLSGLWQSSPRAHEQVWRALSNMPQTTMLNIVIQPSILYEGEKEMLLEAKKIAKETEQDEDDTEEAEPKEKKPEETIFSDYIAWADTYIKRRLAPWKKFFLLQIHLLADGAVDENLLRSIGSAVTREMNGTSLPGFQIARPNSADEEKDWREKIRSLDFLSSPMHINDLADLDEVFAVFRFPYRPEAGLPGANFISAVKDPPTDPPG
ncbi:MAG: hypothetical protein HYZ21_05945 [Chloroflexi bacterium]|nr:hypothetical protein [Chloroflexota bacterium]